MRPKRIGDLAIVGVVKQYGLETDGKMATYFPLQQDPNRGMFVLARSFCISPRFRHSRSNRMANHRIPAQKPAKLKAAMADVLENADNALTPMMRNMIGILRDEWKTVEHQIDELTDKLEQIAASDAGCCRIRQIPGIGPVVATAIVAAIGNGAAFGKGRDFAAWLGLVPRQYSTGGKARLLGISKRGNIYLRKILIHGARAAAMRIKRDRYPNGGWMNALEARAPRNVAKRKGRGISPPEQSGGRAKRRPAQARARKTVGKPHSPFPGRL